MEYSVFIDASVIDFLETVLEKEGTRLLFEIKQIGVNPFKKADFKDAGDEGDLHGLLVDQYAVLYYVDHPVKRIYIVDVTHADQI